MPYPYITVLRSRLLAGALTAAAVVTAAHAQTPKGATRGTPASVIDTHASTLKASAYYHFSIGHLYEELAGAYGNRSDYVNKAIDNYRQVMKEDPEHAGFLVEDIAELYRVSGHIREAVDEAQNALKANPDDLNARRVLAHIYTQEIGDAQANHVDEGMARRAIEQYKLITAKDPKDAESLVMLGRLDRLVGDSVSAEASFKKILESDPDNEDAVTGLAAVYSERNDPKTAAALLEKLTSRNPTPRALVALANNYEQMKQFGQAADAYGKALELDPSRLELKAALAQDQTNAGRYDDAIKTFQELAKANPQEFLPYLGMAQIYREQKDYDQAQRMVDKAKTLSADNLDVRLEEVRLLEAQGKTGDAILLLKNVIDDANRRAGATSAQARADLLDSLGSLYRSDQQFDRAIETFRQAAALASENANREEGQIIETYRAQNDYPKALAESDKALAKFPNDRMLIEVRAEVLSDQGKSDQAVASLTKLLDGKSGHADWEIYLAVADAYGKAKNYAEMGKAIDAADKLSASNDDRATIDFTRGSMFERQKNFDLAEKQFRAALEIDPNNASALNYLGYMLADQGIRLQEAQELIKHAVNLEPNNYAYLDSLGWVYFRQNRLQDAEQQLRRSLEMKGTDATIHDHLGDVYLKEGKLKDAIDQWQASLNAWNTTSPAELETEEVAKVQKKLDNARVRLAQKESPARN
jgi:tetratricopeptide (TPR) repeat protein